MDFRMGNKGSWISVKNYVPGRIQYLYWDTKSNIGELSFLFAGIKVRYKKGYLTHPSTHFIGRFITGWTKDQAKIEESLDIIDKVLRKTDDTYNDFLNMWHQNIIDFQKEGKNDAETGI